MPTVTQPNDTPNDIHRAAVLQELRELRAELRECRRLFDAGIRAFLAAQYPHGIPDDEFSSSAGRWRGR